MTVRIYLRAIGVPSRRGYIDLPDVPRTGDPSLTKFYDRAVEWFERYNADDEPGIVITVTYKP